MALRVINSISLEKERFDKLMPIIAGTDMKVIALCMSDGGMPQTVADRMTIADELVGGLLKNDVAVENIFVDPLVQPVSVNTTFGVEFINAIEQIVKTFPGIRAVDGISFDVTRGQCFGLLGPNGAGKTTTMEILEGISRPLSGQVLYQGRALDREYREDIGIQFQTTALQDFQTVQESLVMFTRLYRESADIDELIELCNLDDILHRDTRKLSGGQRQSIAIAKAVYFNARIIIMDEPTAALGPAETAQVGELIVQLKSEGIGIFLISHDIHDVFDLSDRVTVMYKARKVGTVRPGGDVTKDTIESMIIMGQVPDGVTVEEAEHMMATRLWQNTSKTHFDVTPRADRRRLQHRLPS